MGDRLSRTSYVQRSHGVLGVHEAITHDMDHLFDYYYRLPSQIYFQGSSFQLACAGIYQYLFSYDRLAILLYHLAKYTEQQMPEPHNTYNLMYHYHIQAIRWLNI